MNFPTRFVSMHAFQMLVYRKALHPELFTIKARRQIFHGAYEHESWVMQAGHVMRFRFGSFSVCELLIAQDGNLPVDGAVTAFPVAGEHDFEHEFKQEKVKYITSVQTETLTDTLYASTYDEMTGFAKETNAVVTAWTDSDGGRNLSMLEIQYLNREVNAQSYHLIAHGGIVIRSQTIFEHR